MDKKKFKIAIIAPAPFYYHIPLYRKLAKSSRINLDVYYCSDETIKGGDVKKTYMVDGKFSEDDLLAGYNYKFLKNYSPSSSYLKWPHGLINFGVWPAIKKGNYDAVILQAWTNTTWWIAFFACITSNVPVLFMTDANVMPDYSKSKRKKTVKKILLNFLFQKASGFLTSGKANESFYKYYGANPNKIVNFSFSWGYQEILEKSSYLISARDSIRESLNIKKDDFVVLYVGRFSQEKNPMIILNAFKQIVNKNKRLFFVGDGPLREEIKQKARDLGIQINLAGFQSRESVFKFYAASDVLILPSERETWGIVVNEAMCFNLPIIASDQVGSAFDLVKEGVNGFVFSYHDTNKLAVLIKKIIDMSQDERLILGKNSGQIIADWAYKIDPIEQIVKLLSANFSKKPEEILMISPYLPWPLMAGGSVRMFNLMKELALRGYKITLLAGDYKDTLDNDHILNSICKKIYLYKLPLENNLIFLIKSLFSFLPYPALKFSNYALREKLAMLLKNNQFDLIWMNYSMFIDILPERSERKGTPVIVDQHECEELVYEDYIRCGTLLQKIFSYFNLMKFKSFHKKNYPKIDGIFCVSKEECDFTDNQTKRKLKSWVVPNGIDQQSFYPSPISAEKPNFIVLCSNMGIRRNIEAALWFANSIFPKIKAQIPDAKFWIVGSNPTKEVLDLNSIPGVHVTGKVEDIREYYAMGKVFVAPYLFGAGTKIKILEAMSVGIPIVSTSIGCRGIGVVNEKHVLIADTEEDFSQKVVDLLKDPAKAKILSENSLSLIKEKFIWQKIVDDLEEKIL